MKKGMKRELDLAGEGLRELRAKVKKGMLRSTRSPCLKKRLPTRVKEIEQWKEVDKSKNGNLVN